MMIACLHFSRLLICNSGDRFDNKSKENVSVAYINWPINCGFPLKCSKKMPTMIRQLFEVEIGEY